MKAFASLLLLAAIGLLAERSPAAQAQQPAPSLRLDLTAPRKVYPTAPLPDPETLEREVERALDEMRMRQRLEGQVRESVQRRREGPGFDHDVVNGIQSLRITEALRGRGR